MNLRMRQLLISLAPFLLLGGTGLALLAIAYDASVKEQERISQQDTLRASSALDGLLFNVSRLADELAYRQENLEKTILSIEESLAIDRFQAYNSDLKIRVAVLDPKGIIRIRNWDPWKHGDPAPTSWLQREKHQLLTLGDSECITLTLPLKNEEGNTLGSIIVGLPINKQIASAIRPSDDDTVTIGFKDKIIAVSAATKTSTKSFRSESSVLPDLWIAMSRSSSTFQSQESLTKTLAVAFLIIGILAGIASIHHTQRHIIEPIEAIYRLIISNPSTPSNPDFPYSEIGDLGRALYKQQRDLQDKSRDLETLNRIYKREASLTKVMSHDLSNPLSTLKLSTQRLKSNIRRQDAATLQIIDRMNVQIETMASVISHVRDMKALESGKRSLKLSQVEFGSIISEVSKMFEDRLADKKIRLEWPISDESTSILVDPISFRISVIANIISNAIKFSTKNSVIEVRCRHVNGRSRIDVRDYGAGIPKNLIPTLFSTDKETTRSGTAGEQGTGFGLPLAQFYVNLYGGSIEIESRLESESPLNHGTTVSIYLNSTIEGSIPSVPAPESAA